MKRRTKIIVTGIAVAATIPSIAFGWHFHGGTVHDPWRMAKNVADYTEQAKEAVASSQLYIAMAKQLAEMAGVDVENSNNKVVQALNRYSKYKPEKFDAGEWFKPLNYMDKNPDGTQKEEIEYNAQGDYEAYVAMEKENNQKYLETLKDDASSDNIYQKAIDDITAIQGKSNLSEWQKANYAEALDIVKKSQRISQMAKKMEWIVKRDTIQNVKESTQNAAQASHYNIKKADPFIDETKTTAPDGTVEVDTVSYSSPTMGLAKF